MAFQSRKFPLVSFSWGGDPRREVLVEVEDEAKAEDEEVNSTLCSVSDGSPFTFFMLEHTGKLTSLSWNNQSSSWVPIASHPVAACDIYSSYGPFGYCDLTVGGETCRCLDGFEPSGLDISRGCRRKETLTCGKQSYFVPLSLIKVPDKFLHILNRSLEECEAECSSNCSCTAYAYTSFSHDVAKADLSRCLVWTGELIDTEKYSGDSFFTPGKSINAGENLYLRLADSHGMHHRILASFVYLLSDSF
ncbi:hypothetical protein VPH35_040158 [Triticum aestivum]|uniref:S-locus-specific glycoprotein n=1 Tax=Aegilops tauschii TaxID=37682 RepID=M8BFQ4_AEGTA